MTGSYANGDIRPDQHGFILTGDTVLYGGHQAMFHMPQHCYQTLIQLSFEDTTGRDVQQFYLDRRRQNPTKQYLAINPQGKELLLPKMLEDGGFPAELWEFSDYDFTKNLLIPAKDFTVKIDKVLHHRQFHPADKEQLPTRFFLFGTEKEAHLAHYMVWDEDYQLIVDLTKVPSGVTKEQLAAGVLIDVHFDTRSTTSDPMTPYQGKDLDATVLPAGMPEPYTDAAGMVPPQGGTRIKVGIGQTRWFDMKFLNGGHGLSQEQGTYAQLTALAGV